MAYEVSFGNLVKDRRLAIGLTQAELATRVGCATITIRKIENDAMRPSTQIAERLAMALDIPLDERGNFVRLARTSGLKTPEPLPVPTPAPLPEEIGEEDLTGRAVRGFQLGERIGAGGFGAVYRAVQPGVEREVAVKIILPQYANHPDFIRRFEAEAQLVARLEHPHIVPLYDYWREPNAAFLVMRLLRGGSLKEHLRGGALPLDFILKLLDQIGTALHTAHRFGVIHRDLKPANILLDEDQNAYLADFGIAKNLGNPNLEDQTQAGAWMGSPAYISPEQIRSESIRPQADIYCLGVLLYEMLTGSLPFQGPTPIDYMMQHLKGSLPLLTHVNPDLPPVFDVVVRKATAKDPNERYADIPSLLAELRPLGSAQIDLERVAWDTSQNGEGEAITNPFKGLRAFGEADSEHFFGREQFIQRLLGRLSEEKDISRFLAVVGPSGSGKSSLVKAGLIPALRRGGLPGSEQWFVVDFLPGSHPFEELEAALLRVAVNPPPTLLEQLLSDERGLLRAIRRILPGDEMSELVLVIDQFEELFTLVSDEATRRRFLDSLITAVMDPRSRLRVVITMRADFTDRPLQYVDFGELMEARSVFVLPLTPDELEKVVTGPARHVGLTLEPGLTARIVRELGDQPGTLPLLQYALTELFERRDGRKLTLTAYDEMGGVLGALGRRAEDIYAGLDEPAQSAARQLFLRLVTLGEGVEDTRRRVLRSELASLDSKRHLESTKSTKPHEEKLRELSELSGSKLASVIEAFGKARLLTFDRDPVTRGPTVEVAHEALLREWPRLRGWLTESRADVRLQRTLSQAAGEWTNAQRDAGLLLRGTRLTQLDTWAQETTLALTAHERAFLEASSEGRKARQAAEMQRQDREQALEQRSRNFLRGLVGVFAVAAVIALSLSIFAFRQARLAFSRELAASSIVNLGIDPERSMLLALHALTQADTLQAQQVLHEAVLTSRVLQRATGIPDEGFGFVAYSPDSTRLANVGFGPNLDWLNTQVRDAETLETLFTIPGELLNGEWHDADHLFTIDFTDWEAPASLMVWDMAGRFITSYPLSTLWKDVFGIDLSPDLTQIAFSTGEGTITILDAETGQTVQLLGEVNTVPAIWLQFSPDGTRLLSSHGRQAAGFVTLWDVATRRALLTWPAYFPDRTVFSPDGKRFAVAEFSNILIVDISTGQELLKLTDHSGQIRTVLFSTDGKWLLTSAIDGSVRIWDVESGQTLFELTLDSTFGNIEANFSPDGTQVVTTLGNGVLQKWGVTPADSREWLTVPIAEGCVFPLGWGGIAISPDGTMLITNCRDMVRVLDAVSGQTEKTLTSPAQEMGSQAFNPDGTHLAAIKLDNTLGDSVVVWDVATGREVQELSGHTNRVWSIAYSPDGTQLATISYDQSARIWDSATGETLFILEKVFTETLAVAGQGIDLAFSPDGTRLATAGGTSIKVWDTATGEELLKFPPWEDQNEKIAYSIAFSPDGTRLAVGFRFGASGVWDAGTGEKLFDLSGHTGSVTDIAYSPDGKQIASVSLDGTTRLWDAATGVSQLTLKGHADQIMFVLYSPDGTRLITQGNDGTVIVYGTQLDDLINLALSRLTRWFTPAECLQYLHTDTCPPDIRP